MHWIARTFLAFFTLVFFASVALAQQAAPPSAEPAATPAPDAAAAPPAEQGGAEAAPTPPPAEAEPPPPTFPGATEQPAAEPPPPPQYGQLGGPPRPDIQEGDWDPWEHAPAGKHRHDGFFLRLALGFGGGSVHGENGVEFDEVTYSGGAVGFDIGIGGALTDNFILHGEIFQLTLFDPDMEETPDQGFDKASDLGIEDIAMAGLGVGVTYYFMPINIYLSGSIAFGQVIYENDQGDIDDSDVGFGLSLMAGKEWWVGIDWGIGVALQLLHVRADEDYDGDLSATSLAVMFSATHN